MQARLIILAGVVGLDLSDASNAVFMSEVVKDMRHLDMFIEFCRDKKEGITYTTKSERLDILANRFKKLEEKERLKDKYANGDAWTDGIVWKVSQCRTMLINARAHEEYMCSGKDIGFKHLVKPEHKEKLFTNKELSALHSVGSTTDIIGYCEDGSLKSKLMAVYMAAYKRKSSYKALGLGAKRVMSLVSMSAEKMEA